MLIYVITNRLNGKQYVGQTIGRLDKRLKDHIAAAHGWKRQEAKHGVRLLSRAINKYGDGSFEIRVAEKCVDKKLLDEREAFWVRELNTLAPNGYNILEGRHQSPTTKALLRPRKTGYSLSEETRRRQSLAHKGIPKDRKTVDRVAAAHRGMKRSVEARRNMSRAMTKNRFVLISPDGIAMSPVTSLNDWCNKRGFLPSMMYRIAKKGYSYTHHGWRCVPMSRWAA